MSAPLARLLEKYAASYRDRPSVVLEAIALQLADPTVRSLLAHLATNGATSYTGLAASFAEDGLPPATVPPGQIDRTWLAALARVVALQDTQAEDRATSLNIYRHLHGWGGVGRYGRRHAKLFGDLLLHFGCDWELQSLLASADIVEQDRRFLVADLHNPWRGGPLAVDAGTWLSEFALAGEFCDEPPLRLDEHEAPFDRLTTMPARPAVADGLISVVIPVFRPPRSLASSVGSLLAQSWEDLEIILVDDGSGPDHRDLLEEQADRDRRVKLVRLPRNAGAYTARNVGLSLSRGRFVAFQDHDDWSHPRRLELQARPLLEDRSLVATHSRCARVNPSLVFAHLGYHPLRHNASSLMIRRRDVMLGVGYFDEVRKSGDSEYHERIVAHFGASAVHNLTDQPVLAAVRRLDNSLSRSDFRAGWHHPDRVWYRESYRRWHARTDRSNLFIDKGGAARPFAGPRSFHSEFRGAPTLDVIVVSDWHADVTRNHALLAWCQERTAGGARVGVAHMDSLVHTTRARLPLLPQLVDLVHDGTVTHVGLHEQATSGLVVVAMPSVLMFSSTVSSWDVGEAVLVDDHDVAGATADEVSFDRELAIHAANLVFGMEPRFLGSLRELQVAPGG